MPGNDRRREKSKTWNPLKQARRSVEIVTTDRLGANSIDRAVENLIHKAD